jgi:hypothetical protein
MCYLLVYRVQGRLRGRTDTHVGSTCWELFQWEHLCNCAFVLSEEFFQNTQDLRFESPNPVQGL